MNKNLSLAIEKAVEKINPRDNFPVNSYKPEKKPDLFTLTSTTELFQNDKGITIKIDRSRDAKLTDFGKVLFEKLMKTNLAFCLFYRY